MWWWKKRRHAHRLRSAWHQKIKWIGVRLGSIRGSDFGVCRVEGQMRGRWVHGRVDERCVRGSEWRVAVDEMGWTG